MSHTRLSNTLGNLPRCVTWGDPRDETYGKIGEAVAQSVTPHHDRRKARDLLVQQVHKKLKVHVGRGPWGYEMYTRGGDSNIP